MIDLLNNFGELLNHNIYISIIIALIAGIVSSFSPCSLSTLPLIIGYVGNDTSNKKGWLYSILFALGLIFTFTMLGIFSVMLGESLRIFGNYWNYILIAILLFVTLQLFGVFKHKEHEHCHRPKLRKSAIGAFFLGIIGGIFDSPCSTPVLAVILTYTSTQGNILFGAILMAVYSLGHSLLIILAGTSLDIINKLSVSKKYMKIGETLKIVFGIITLLMALYMLYQIF